MEVVMKSNILIIVSIVFLYGCEGFILKYPEEHPPSEDKRETCYYYAKIKVETRSGTPCDSAQAYIISFNVGFTESDSLGIIRIEFSIYDHPTDSMLTSAKIYKYHSSTPDCPMRERLITFQHGPNKIVNPDSFWAEITPHVVKFTDYP
jgi:hypothetical protein